MIVVKFGGSSVANAERIRHVGELVKACLSRRPVIVLSAMGDTTDHLLEAGKTALPLITGATIMLVLAACIEAFWSSRHGLSLPLRYGSGVLLWILMILYFVFAGRKKN